MSLTSTDFQPMLIGGERRPALSGDTIDAVNPATGELLGRIPRGGRDDVEAAVAAAREAFTSWRRTSIQERAALLERLAARIGERADEFALLDVADNGSPIKEMRKDAHYGAWFLRHFASMALHLRGETIPTDHDRINYTLRQPFGVVARLIPYNHPMLFAAARIAAPLLAGNTVILKPSEHTSLSALALADDLAEIFPPGVVNVVTGYGVEAGDALVVHPEIRRLAFIGAAETGRTILQRAATHVIKSVTLELGGKNPCVVFPDADIDLAIDGAFGGMNFTWQGQSCGSTSRLLVHRDLHDTFVERLVERLEALSPGLPHDPETDTGSMVNQLQFDRVMEYIRIGSEDDGAKLVTGGTRVTADGLGNGYFIRPALFTGVKPDSRIAQEEIFGPVLAVMPFDDYDDALRIANGVRYGLTASVFTRDLSTAHRFARDVETGYVWVNEWSKHVQGTSFGGVKDSGLGREEDFEELASYTQPKNVHMRIG